MPTDKRERQRAGREARRAEARAAMRRSQRRRRLMSIGALVLGVVGIGLFISLTGGDESDTASTSATTTTALDPADGTTTSVAIGTAECPPAGGAPERKAAFDGPPKDCLTEGASYSAAVETDLGSFTIDLDREKAPNAVNNFVFLARYRAYEDIPFHRVIPGFVVQGGDVAGQNGTGDAGYKIAEEPPKAGDYEIGSVAMAKATAPNSTGSQFFVVTGDQGVKLPPEYSLFGKVTDGLEVVKKIEADGDTTGTPKVTHKIVKVTITEKKG